MSPGPGRGIPVLGSVRARLVAALLVPAIVLAGCALVRQLGLVDPPGPAALDARASEIQRWLDGELEAALATAQAFLDGRPDRAPVALSARRDGVGILDADLHYLSWDGTPPEPDPRLVAPTASRWQVRRSGVHVRLVARAGPDGEGRIALASFVVDSRLEELSAERLLPARLLGGVDLALEFEEDPARAGVPQTGGDRRSFATPDGTLLARATLRAGSTEHAAAMWASRSWAWAAIVAAITWLALVPWTPVTGSALAWGASAIGLSRLALGLTRAPAWVLGPELGTAKVFGTPAAWRLAESPADLVLSALAAYGLARLLAAGLARLARVRVGLAATLAGAAALLGLGLAGWIVHAVATSSSVPLLDALPLWRSSGRLAVGLALCLALLAAADLLVVLLRIVRRQSDPARGGIGAALLLFGLVLATGLVLEALDARVALERIRSEYATLVVDPLPARKLALASTLERVREAFADGQHRIDEPDPERLAYELWVESELFTGGHRSSLDVYDSAGTLVSHFGFDLPLLAEDEVPDDRPGQPVAIREGESFRPVAAVRQQLLHGAVRLGPAGRLGWVVGHVLDEPHNLAFLPGSRPYLAALSAGAPFSGLRAPEGVEYVLYEASGTVVLSTLTQPPPMSEVLVQALERAGRIDVLAGDERWAGIALQDGEHRLHALLAPSPDRSHAWPPRCGSRSWPALSSPRARPSCARARRDGRAASCARCAARSTPSCWRRCSWPRRCRSSAWRSSCAATSTAAGRPRSWIRRHSSPGRRSACSTITSPSRAIAVRRLRPR